MRKLSVSAGNRREKGWVVQAGQRLADTANKKKEHHREVSEKEC